jgi:hypothetical protein
VQSTGATSSERRNVKLEAQRKTHMAESARSPGAGGVRAGMGACAAGGSAAGCRGAAWAFCGYCGSCVGTGYSNTGRYGCMNCSHGARAKPKPRPKPPRAGPRPKAGAKKKGGTKKKRYGR